MITAVVIIWGILAVAGIAALWFAMAFYSELAVVNDTIGALEEDNARLEIKLDIAQDFLAQYAGQLEAMQQRYEQVVQARRATRRQKSRKGVVYLLHDIEVTGFYKIGRTNRPKRRLRELETMWPFEFEVVHIFETDDAISLEAELHRRYADKRQRGEWFDLSYSDVAAIVSANGHSNGTH